MRRRACFSTFCGAALILLAAALPLSACPMCKLATESASRQPKAYMYSILFMMSMPATIMSGFGIAFYRLSRKAARMQQEAAAAELNQIRAADAPTDPAAQRGSVVEPDSGTAGGQTAGGLVFP